MVSYSKSFLNQLEKVRSAEKKLAQEKLKLEALCPHVDLSGNSTFPAGTSFVNCTICGLMR